MKRLISYIVILFGLPAMLLAVTPTPSYTGPGGGLGVGDSNTMSAVPGSGQMAVQYPTFNPPMSFQPATASSSCYAAITITTTTFKANTTSWTLANANFTDEITPRNVVLVASFTTGTSTKTVVASAVVTGKDLFGNTQTETISFSTNTGTGNYAFASITSIVPTCTSIMTDTSVNVIISIGSGVKIGLPCMLDSASEVSKVIGNGTLDTTYTLNTTYNTMTFATAPNGTYVYYVYTMPQMR